MKKMKLYHDLYELSKDLGDKKIALTIGNFDGVHSGHQYLISNFIKYSQQRNLIPIILTFSPHPYSYISGKDNYNINIDSDNYKMIHELGVEYICVLEFNERIKKCRGKEFIENVLDTFHVTSLYLGHDFSLGENKDFGEKELVHFFEKRVDTFFESPFKIKDQLVSSSLVRESLAKGKIKLVNKLLNRPYSIAGKVVKGNNIGRTLGFPTANIAYNKKLILPKPGVYFARAKVMGKTYRAAVNIGVRPSVTKDSESTVEAYLLNFDKDIYGEQIELNFINFIRNEIKFKTKETLVTQISEDVKVIKKSIYEIDFALIGKNIIHSRSAQIYSKLLGGFPINYKLLNYEREEEIGDLKSLLKLYKHISVTAPYKKYCFNNSNPIHSNLKIFEAINTLKLEQDQVVSENTDYQAINELISNYMKPGIDKVFLLGDGSMAKVLKKVLQNKKIAMEQFSRKLKNLNEIVDNIEQVNNRLKILVINSCARDYLFPEITTNNFIFWDLNYAMPKHLERFHRAGVKYIDGMELLELQAKYALSFWNCKSS